MPTYVRSSGQWLPVSGSNVTGTVFPSGTLMLFQQTSAPTGWTKQTTHNDKTLRVVSGTASSGGSTAFTSVFTSRTPTGSNSGGSVSNTTLSTAQVPDHTHFTGYYGSLTNGYNAPVIQSYNSSDLNPQYTGGAGLGGGSHGHGFTNPTFTGTAMDFAVQYVDLIIASKN